MLPNIGIRREWTEYGLGFMLKLSLSLSITSNDTMQTDKRGLTSNPAQYFLWQWKGENSKTLQ